MSKYAIELKNISKIYKDGDSEYCALNNVSLAVKHGEVVAIVGPSGSGKTSLLSIAGALLSPTNGEVIIGDLNISQESKKTWTKIRRNHIGFVFQSHQLIPFLTTKQQLTYMSSLKETSYKDSYIDELITDLGLTKRKDAYPSQMSGGEKQRVAIARAFVNEPNIILADEPTASLDGVRGRQVMELFCQETKKHNKAAIIVTHDERVLDLVDTIYKIENGILTLVSK